VMDSTTIEVTSSATGCTALLTNTNASCIEVEELDFDTVTADTIAGQNLGIVSCTPDACTFSAQDEPCVVGDGAGPVGESNYTLAGDVLTFSSVEPSGLCGKLEMIQTWERQ